MQIQKGLVKYKDRSDIVCTYGITDEGTQYYFLDGNNLTNGYIIASTALVEAIDPMVECSAIGVINQDGRMIIPFENKSIKVISNDMLLVERAVPLNPTVLEAIQLRSDPLAATRLVTTPAAIKDKINASMGVEGRFIFNDQFSEATIYDINGNNLFNNEYYSFIAMTKNKLYFSKNTSESPVMELTFSNVVEEAPVEEVPTIPKLDIETASVSREEIEDAINSKNEVITDSSENTPVEDNNLVQSADTSITEDTVSNEEINTNVVSNEVVDSALSGNVESSDNAVDLPNDDITAETIKSENTEASEDNDMEGAFKESIDKYTDSVESEENEDSDEKETEEDSNDLVNDKDQKEPDEVNDTEDKELDKDDVETSDDAEKSTDEEINVESEEKEETTDKSNSSEDEKQELKINIDDSENEDFDINFSGINLDSQEEAEDNKNTFNEFSADSINFDDNLDNDYDDSLFGGINTDNLLDEMDDGLEFNSMLKKDNIVVDDYDIDYRSNGVVKDTIIEDVASTMTNLIKSNRNQKKRIEMCESHINQLNTAGKKLLQKTKSQSREIDSLKNKIKSYEAMISKLESRNQVLDSKVNEQEKLIVSQTNELDMLRPQVEGKKDLVRLIEDAQSLLSQDK